VTANWIVCSFYSPGPVFYISSLDVTASLLIIMNMK
jgi:hypothetical protein